jgi:uncharacterized protein
MRGVSFYIFAGLFFGLLTAGTLPAQTFYGTEDVKEFRAGRDKEFRNRDESPLLDADFEKFEGLNYFETTGEFRVRAKFTETPDEKYFLMPTSSGKSVKYKKAGLLTFQIGEEEFALTAYRSEKTETDPEWNRKYGQAFFIPFKDLTNGAETYGGGRYIYMKIPAGPETVLDFNLTFNPSCAYGSDRYSCPLPPRENYLNVEIKAGEKSFDYTHAK